MDCEECRRLIDSLEDSDINSRLRLSLEEHVKNCPDCSEYRFKSDLASDLLIRALGDDEIEPSDHFDALFNARLEQTEKTGDIDARPEPRRIPPIIKRGAAAVLIAAGLIALIVFFATGERKTTFEKTSLSPEEVPPPDVVRPAEIPPVFSYNDAFTRPLMKLEKERLSAAQIGDPGIRFE